jgi:trk system potassium uptake protein
VLGVRPKGAAGKKLEVPGPDYRIASGDTLLLAGDEKAINRFVREGE